MKLGQREEKEAKDGAKKKKGGEGRGERKINSSFFYMLPLKYNCHLNRLSDKAHLLNYQKQSRATLIY